MISQRFLDKVAYNQDLPADFWSVDAASAASKSSSRFSRARSARSCPVGA